MHKTRLNTIDSEVNCVLIDKLNLAKGAALAPMAGSTDVVMRTLCAGYGAVFTVSEMASAKSITLGDKVSRALLEGRGEGAPYGVQLFGHDAATMGEAAALVSDIDHDFIDINMGCPAPKIVRGGAGSALLKEPKKAAAMAAAAVKNSIKPVSVKMRIGWDEDSLTGVEVAQRCEAAGVAMLTVHGRTREQLYHPGVNTAAVAEIKKAVSIPVLFNGDVNSADAAKEALGQTGCDGVMVGRAANGQPWLFAEIAAAMQGKPLPAAPSLRQRMQVLAAQVTAMCERRGEASAMRAARGIVAAYMHGLNGAASLRHASYALTSYADLERLIALVYERNPLTEQGSA